MTSTEPTTIEPGVPGTAPYVRGSKTERIKTARLVPGDRVLTTSEPYREFAGFDREKREVIWGLPEEGRYGVAVQKGTATVRVVAKNQPYYDGKHRQSRRRIDFTDGSHATDLAPIQTWHALVVDRESSAARQTFIDEGFYPTESELAHGHLPPSVRASIPK